MSTDMNEEQVEFSLADLANLDATDIAILRSETLPAGVYDFEGISGKFEQFEQEDETKFRWKGLVKVIAVITCLERGVDKEALIGKTHTETKLILPSEAAKGIGYIRGVYDDMGLPSDGPLGGANGEDGEPIIGFVDGIEGHVFRAKITKRPNKNDPGRPFAGMSPDGKYNKAHNAKAA